MVSSPEKSAIETELRVITKLKPGKNEPRNKFLHRLWDAAYSLPPEDWDNLSTPAANWANEVTGQHKDWRKKKANGEFSPVDFPDAVLAKAPAEELEEPEEVEEEAPKAKKSTKGQKPAEEPTEEDEPEEDEPEEDPKRGRPEPEEKPEEDELAEEPEEDEEEDEEDEPAEEPEEAKAKPKSKKEPAAAKSEPEPEVAGKPLKWNQSKPKPVDDEPRLNVQGMVRAMMIENPFVALDELHGRISEEAGAVVSLTTVRASHSWFRAALKDLQRHDCLSKAFKAKLVSGRG